MSAGAVWRPPKFIANPVYRHGLTAAIVLYLIWSVSSLGIDWDRLAVGLPRAGNMFARMVPPDFSRWELLLRGLVESLQMALAASFVGMILAIPLGLCAASNLMPRPVYLVARAVIALTRTFHEVVIAIFFVKIFGFGPLAGVLTLIVASMSFIAKMLAEDIENMSSGQVEAVRATGASFPAMLIYAIVPQILPRYLGVSIYRLDANVRHSTVVGIVGAGGIGQTLAASFSRYDYDFSLAILLTIIALVFVGEIFSNWVREATSMTVAEHARRHPDVWRRFSPRQTLVRYAWYLGIVFVAVWSVSNLDIPWFYFLDAHVQAADLMTRMFPPDWGYFGQILDPLLETIHIATLGTIVTFFVAFPIAILAAGNVTPNAVTWFIGRFILVASRSVNTVVWALVFVAIFGPGPMAGVWAIAARSIGFVGKLVAESIEEIDEGTIEAIEATGASRLQVLLVGVIPQVLPVLFGTMVYRWDINIRESTVLGFVGAGGIGIQLYASINQFAWREVAVMLIAVFGVVIVSEFVSATVRARIN